jgi:hypothetical protein
MSSCACLPLVGGLAFNFTITHQVGNSAGISKAGENNQLLIAIVLVAQLKDTTIKMYITIMSYMT